MIIINYLPLNEVNNDAIYENAVLTKRFLIVPDAV